VQALHMPYLLMVLLSLADRMYGCLQDDTGLFLVICQSFTKVFEITEKSQFGKKSPEEKDDRKFSSYFV